MFRVRYMVIIFFAVFIISRLAPVDAVSATAIGVSSILDVNGDCTQLQVDVSITDRQGNTADNVLDFYYVVIYDGNGTPHYSKSLGATVPSTTNVVTTIDGTFHNPLSARPMRIVMYDVNVAGTLPISTVESFPLVVESTFDPATFVSSCGATISTSASTFTSDGRLNTVDLYPQQTVAVYCRSGGVIDLYAIDPITAEGALAIRVATDIIEDTGIPEDSNIMIAEAGDSDIKLYRLTTGEFQVMGRENYVFIWDGCG